jgi:hypothetical protein
MVKGTGKHETFTFADELTPKSAPTKTNPAQKLLDWLNRRPGDFITARDIRIYGPGALRNRESALRSAQILAAHGFLIPLAAHKWQVVRKNLAPTL